jgi:hypothetical protein
MADQSITAWWGALTGSAGFLLASWTAWRTQRLRLSVRPQVSSRTPAERQVSRFSVRITNLSPYSVTVERAGLVCGHAAEENTVELGVERDSGPTLPVELGPRTAVVLGMSMRATIEATTTPFRYAFAETACGAKRRSPWWSSYRGKMLRQILDGAPSRR